MITIREFEKADLCALRQLFLETKKKTFSWVDGNEFSLMDFDRETKGEYILVAFVDNRLAGFISVWLADKFIHHLYVSPDCQHKGIGSLLLHAMIDKINFPLTLKCLERNKEALLFYKKKGFIEKGIGQTEQGSYFLMQLLQHQA